MVVFSVVFLLFFFLFLVVACFNSYLWDFDRGYNKGVRVWSSSFECGFLSHRFSENYFSFSYLILLVFFVVFDLEVSLLLNVPFQGVLYKNAGFFFLFLFFLSLGFIFEVERGYVGWSY